MAVVRAQEKSPEAFRTISEVATELDVPQHVLRFWESKFGAVKPLKRGGGRRYYRPDDMELLRGIRALLYRDGLTIRGVQKILREQGTRHVIELGRSLVGTPAVAVPRSALAEAAPLSPAHAFLERGEPAEPGAFAGEGGEDEPEYGLTQAERARLEALLGELLELKDRLHSARRIAVVPPRQASNG